MNDKIKTAYAVQVCRGIKAQIIAGIGPSAWWSWGVRRQAYAYDKTGNVVLLLTVSALRHKGTVAIRYDEGPDTYTVTLHDGKGVQTFTRSNVYCDVLGTLIDGLIERDPALSDDEYRRLALADSERKIAACE